MNNFKKILSFLLTFIFVLCLTGAGFLFLKKHLDEKNSQALTDSMRASAEAMEAEALPETQEGNTAHNNADQDTAAMEMPAASASSQHQASDTADSETNEDMPSPASSAAAIPTVPNPYADSFSANEDMAAWILIPGTNIDYPVMWTPRDEQYYLYRDFEGKDNQNGCLILDTDSCLDPLTTNLIIHGHNMRSGAMFGNLTEYESEDFYKDHKQITLYTEECARNYEVIAVFRSQVYKKTDQVFKFYKFFQADSQEEFDDFYQNIKSLSLYDTDVTAEYGDHFLTLSTCVYHVEQGRFVVVAKEIEEGDHYDPIP